MLKAGVLPALSAGSGGEAPQVVLFMNAGPDLLGRLAETVAVVLRADVNRVVRDLRGGGDSVANVMQRVAAMTGLEAARTSGACADTGPQGRVVVIVDRFEQAMIATGDSGQDGGAGLESFLEVLRAMTCGPVPVAAVLGVRMDFLNSAMHLSSLRALTRKRAPVLVGPMDEDELTEVIERPAQRMGLKLATGFVEVLLREVSARDGRAGHRAGTLPLLSHALHETWQRSGGREMTVQNYRAVGGVDGAVRASAEKVYAALSPGQQVIARRLFLSLVIVHRSGADTRRRVTQDQLFEEIEGGVDLEEVLDRFVAQRLLTVDEETVEITHEVLMEAWPQLRTWLDADRGGLLAAQQLNDDARAWDAADRPAADLYVGTRLEAARQWRDSHPADINKLSQTFLDAAIRQARRATRILKSTVALLGVLLLLNVALTLVISDKSETAQRQRDQAQSRTLASRVSGLRSRDPGLARQLALAAYRISPTTEARSALIDATAMPPAVRMLGGANLGIMYAVGIHPSGKIAAAAAENTVRLWDITDTAHPRPRPDPPSAKCVKIYALAFSPSGDLLAASCADGSVRLWDTRDPMAPTALLGADRPRRQGVLRGVQS
ncbi:WD40 repeat domain-containing protein [Actinomadura luteofluorescens]|uniref:WD40 repeat domain-containing protein n=1 Tax=Actinomadura luteofluorescens TaxID=46163 RepID=UPI00364055A5